MKPYKIEDDRFTFRFPSEEGSVPGKCTGCNWHVTYLYVIAYDMREARELLKSGDAGLCGSCYSDLLAGMK